MYTIPGRIYNAMMKFCDNKDFRLDHLYYNRTTGTINATNKFVYLEWELPENMRNDMEENFHDSVEFSLIQNKITASAAVHFAEDTVDTNLSGFPVTFNPKERKELPVTMVHAVQVAYMDKIVALAKALSTSAKCKELPIIMDTISMPFMFKIDTKSVYGVFNCYVMPYKIH